MAQWHTKWPNSKSNKVVHGYLASCAWNSETLKIAFGKEPSRHKKMITYYKRQGSHCPPYTQLTLEKGRSEKAGLPLWLARSWVGGLGTGGLPCPICTLPPHVHLEGGHVNQQPLLGPGENHRRTQEWSTWHTVILSNCWFRIEGSHRAWSVKFQCPWASETGPVLFTGI